MTQNDESHLNWPMTLGNTLCDLFNELRILGNIVYFLYNQRISHCDQVQFLLETQELFNISKAINVAHHIKKQKIKL